MEIFVIPIKPIKFLLNILYLNPQDFALFHFILLFLTLSVWFLFTYKIRIIQHEFLLIVKVYIFPF